MTHDPISIRRAGEDDRAALLLLAVLDGGRPLAGEVLLARVGDEPWAAMEVDTGAAVADPFRRSAHVLELLRLRVAAQRRRHAGATRRRRLRRRWATA